MGPWYKLFILGPLHILLPRAHMRCAYYLRMVQLRATRGFSESRGPTLEETGGPRGARAFWDHKINAGCLLKIG